MELTAVSGSSTPRPRDVRWIANFSAFWGVHALAVAGVLYLGWSWSGLALALGLYVGRMFFVTGAYHRYFSHRTFKTSRWFQFVLAFCAQTSAQKGALWWAARHREHHKYSDTPQDLHSPRQSGFWWSHVGWIVAPDYDDYDQKLIGDFQRFPELRLLQRYNMAPPVLLGVALFLIGGLHGLVWGMLVSTVLLWHGTFTINSLAHVFGSRRYDTTDDSRNNWLLALITMGEGWHNNHHHYQSSTRQGFYWWELDLTYLILKGMEKVGLVWDLREPPARVYEKHRDRDDDRAAPLREAA